MNNPFDQFDAAPRGADDDTDYLVRTVWGEARGEPAMGRKAVASVIRNRAKKAGKPIRDIVLEDGQFEPWGDQSRRAEMEALDPSSDDYRSILRDIEGDDDVTGGATHFFSPNAQAALGRPPPAWATGAGQDIGGHRFYRVDAAPQPAATNPFDRFDEPDAADEPDDDFLGDVTFVANPKTAMRPGRGFVDAESGENLNEAQSATYAALAKVGKLDPNATHGSAAFPLAQRNPDDLPKPGDFYVSVDGELKQVPGVPWTDTLKTIISKSNPERAHLQDADPRSAAIARGLQSGALLGGRNEAIALAESLPALVEGLPQVKERFGEVLQREDQLSGRARQDFPLAYGGAAATGALAVGAAIPGGRLATAGVGAYSGFVATDGDVQNRAIGAGLGVLGGEAARLAIPRLGGAVMDTLRIPRKVTPDAIASAEAALADMGTRLDDLSPAARDALTARLRRGVEPRDAATLALNEGLPVNIPMNRGDVTGLPGDQWEFNSILRNRQGSDMAAEAQQFVREKQEGLIGNVDAIAGSMAGDGVPMIGRGGELASDFLSTQRQVGEKAVSDAYKTARESGEAAWIGREEVPKLAARLREATAAFPPSRIGGTREALAKLDEVGGTTRVRDLFEIRAMLSNLRTEAGPDAAAAGAAVRELDAFTKQAVEEDLISGDKNAVKLWKTAIAKNREHAQIFKQGDLVDKITAREGFGDQSRLSVDPGDAANVILGRSNLGFVGRVGLYRDMEKVRDLLGPDSEAWNALRTEAFVRIANVGEGGVEGGARQFSGAKFLKAWSDAKARDMKMIDLLFKPEERAVIDQFASLAAKVTSPVRGGDNPSNTAMALKALQRLGGMGLDAGRAVPILSPAFDWLSEKTQQFVARSTFKPTPRTAPANIPSRRVPGVIGGFGGAALASEDPIY